MPLQTRLTTALGIEHPILLAPMDLVAGGKLAAAVSHAGGLGLIGGGYGNADWLEQEFAAASNAKVGCGFITWSLAEKPGLLHFRVPDTSSGQGCAWALHQRLLQPRPASFDTGLCQSGSVRKAGRIVTKPLFTKPKQIQHWCATIISSIVLVIRDVALEFLKPDMGLRPTAHASRRAATASRPTRSSVHWATPTA